MKTLGATPHLAIEICQSPLVKLHRWDFKPSSVRTTAQKPHADGTEAQRDHRTRPPFRRRYLGSPTRNQL